MKFIKLVFIVMFIAISNIAYGVTKPSRDDKDIIVVSKEIQNLLKRPNFSIEHNMDATVKFMINKHNEIVVLSVETNIDQNLVASYVKSRLNYKKLSKNIISKVYTLPIKFVKKN